MAARTISQNTRSHCRQSPMKRKFTWALGDLLLLFMFMLASCLFCTSLREACFRSALFPHVATCTSPRQRVKPFPCHDARKEKPNSPHVHREYSEFLDENGHLSSKTPTDPGQPGCCHL